MGGAAVSGRIGAEGGEGEAEVRTTGIDAHRNSSGHAVAVGQIERTRQKLHVVDEVKGGIRVAHLNGSMR